MNNSNKHSIKIFTFGNPSVGKFSILNRKIHGTFHEIFERQIDLDFQTSVYMDRQEFFLNIYVDTYCDELRAYFDASIRFSDAYVLVFAINNKISFYYIEEFIKRIYLILDKDETEYIPICLVGNKCDLESDRVVSHEDVTNLVTKWNISYLETSAKNNINIDNIFLTIASDFLYNSNQSFIDVENKSLRSKRHKCLLV
ncbi:small monomeric GTPase [Entamoeba marina]